MMHSSEIHLEAYLMPDERLKHLEIGHILTFSLVIGLIDIIVTGTLESLCLLSWGLSTHPRSALL